MNPARFLLLAAALAGPAAAQVGTLDPAFGGDGLHTSHFDERDVLYSVLVQDDGMIVVVGSSEEVGVPSTRAARVARYGPDGALDGSWGYGWSVGGCFSVPTEFQAVVVEPGGRLLAGGNAQFDCAGLQRDFWIHRIGPTGTSERIFDRPVFHGLYESIRALALQPDGRLVAAGVAGSISDATTHDVAVARYDADGTLDSTFGTNGEVLLDVAGDYDLVTDVAVQPDGRVVVVGHATVGGQRDFLLLRLDPDGTPDASFGTAGIVTTDVEGFDDVARRVAIQPDGKVVVAGHRTAADGVTTGFVVARYGPGGTPDATFGAGGLVLVDFTGRSAVATGLFVQSDGRVVASGFTETGAGGVATRDFAIARLLPDGALDPTFAGDGRHTADVTGGGDVAQDLAVQPDGHYVVAGFAEAEVGGELHRDFALARFLGDRPLVAGEPGTGGPAAFALHAPAPNPFARRATLRYDVPAAGRVRVAVHDALGREVAVLVDGERPAGRHEAVFDGAGLANGLYLARLTAPGFARTQRLTLLR